MIFLAKFYNALIQWVMLNFNRCVAVEFSSVTCRIVFFSAALNPVARGCLDCAAFEFNSLNFWPPGSGLSLSFQRFKPQMSVMNACDGVCRPAAVHGSVVVFTSAHYVMWHSHQGRLATTAIFARVLSVTFTVRRPLLSLCTTADDVDHNNNSSHPFDRTLGVFLPKHTDRHVTGLAGRDLGELLAPNLQIYRVRPLPPLLASALLSSLIQPWSLDKIFADL